MITTIIGGSGSGKSEYAENLAREVHTEGKDRLLYVATMLPYGEEGEARVEKHRRQRAGKGFETLESYIDLQGDFRVFLEEHGPVDTLLLECMSNYVANLLFTEEREDVREKVRQDIAFLQTFVANIIVVTLNLFEDGTEYDESTEAYRRTLAMVNADLAAESDAVVEIKASQEIRWK